MRVRTIASAVLIAAPVVWSLQATAQAPADPSGTGASASEGSPPASPAASVAPSTSIAPASDPERKTSLSPKPAAKPPAVMRFVADPLSDGAVLAIAAGFLGLSQVIISSGELKPQQPVSASKLTAMDRIAVTQTLDPRADMLSNMGLYSAIGFAVVDPIVSGMREDNAQTFLVDAILYAQSAAIAGGLTNLAKIAVRRPRPRAYIEQQRLTDLATDKSKVPDITETDAALSFPSGHASTVAAIAATGTYLAFARSPKGSARPWITLIVGFLATAFTSYERIRAGAHFPTDVIGGAFLGAGVGVLVPHIHREQTLKQRPVWIGFSVQPGGGVASLNMTL